VFPVEKTRPREARGRGTDTLVNFNNASPKKRPAEATANKSIRVDSTFWPVFVTISTLGRRGNRRRASISCLPFVRAGIDDCCARCQSRCGDYRLGIFSPIGIGVDPFWGQLGRRAIGYSQSQSLSRFRRPRSGRRSGERVHRGTARKLYIKEKEVRKNLKTMCREIQLGVASATQALQHAGID